MNIFNKNPKSNTNVTNDKSQSKKLVREPDKKKKKNRKVSWVQNDYLLFFLFIFGFSSMCVLLGGIGDSDPYWHTTLGKYILQNGKIPKTDIFSWYSLQNGYTQTCHSWLGSIIIYLFSALFKNTDMALIIFKLVNIVICSIILTIVFKCATKTKDIGDNPSLFALIPAVIATQLLIRCFRSPRPLALGNILFLLSFVILDKLKKDSIDSNKDNKIYVLLLGIIALLIANIHGGALLMLIGITGLYFISQYFPPLIRYAKKCKSIKELLKKIFADIKHLPKMEYLYEKTGVAIITEILFGMINPYFWKIYFYVFFDEDSLAMSIINEWQPSKITDAGLIISFIFFLIIAYKLGKIMSEKKENKGYNENFGKENIEKNLEIENSLTISFSHILLLIAFFIMTAKYNRMGQYLLMVLFLCSLDIYKKINKNLLNIKIKQPLFLKKLSLVVSCFLIFFSCYSVPLTYKSSTSDAPFKNGVVSYLKKADYKRLYTSYGDGGFLIYHGLKSFIDSRSDPFPSDELVKSSYFPNLSEPYFNSKKDIDNYLKKYNFDAILLYKTRDTAAIAYLEQNNQWKIAYQDYNKYDYDNENKAKENKSGFIVFEKVGD